MNNQRESGFGRVVTVMSENFGLNRSLAFVAVCLILIFLGAAIFGFIRSAPPRTLTITSGPPGSSFETNAWKYRAILASNGVELKILPSQGSLENLKRLQDPQSDVDIGFVQGGVAQAASVQNLVSLGSISYQPLFIFYRNSTPVRFLSEFSGKRLAVGAEGSGARTLALTLLHTNGITEGGTTQLLDLDSEAAAKALMAGNVDAVFLMSESVSVQTLRQLFREPQIHLFSFEQADAYNRRFTYLNKLLLPEGSIDLGKNLPAQDVWLLGPTVELVARPKLNAAISDLLIEAAQEVHGKASLIQNRGDFPKPLEHEFRISPGATRYYKSGKGFLYRQLPFWIASLANRMLVALVPLVLVLPGLRLIPAVYKWRMRLRIYRWYRSLLALERELVSDLPASDLRQIHQRLDEIELKVKRMKVPASFADQFYSLRQHIDFVRQKLASQEQGKPA
ncbi:MAG TPA: TAXI family TRAP transporter solute-binding subunit [Verrucomicrobiae bacterium]